MTTRVLIVMSALAAVRVAAQGGGGSGGSNQGLVWGTYGQVSERSASAAQVRARQRTHRATRALVLADNTLSAER
jgi:hypothetical protein